MFQIMIRSTKTLLRDRSLVFFVLLFPSLLVFLLGNLLAMADNPDSKLGVIKLQYVVETRDPAGCAAVNSFIDGLSGSDSVELVAAQDIEAAKALAARDDITAAVLFAEPLSVKLFTGGQSTENRAVHSMISAFSQRTGAMLAVLHGAPQNMAALEAGGGVHVKPKDLGVNRTMLDYYAVAMTVMILFMGAMGGATLIQEERRGYTLQRMIVSPKSRVAIYVQTVLSSLTQVFMQIVVVMLASTLLFGAHYAATWQQNLLLFVMFMVVGMTVMAVFSIFGIILKVNAMLTIMPVLWAAMFISGTFSKEVYISGVTEASPIFQVQNAAFDLTVFGRPEKALWCMAICAVVMAVSLMLGAALFSRKEAVAK